MNLIVLLLTALSSYAVDSKEDQLRKDLKIDQGFYEPVEETIKGNPEFCPTGLIALRSHEGSYQLWIGDRFYLSNINEGDVRLEYDGMPNCYDILNVVASKQKLTKVMTRHCQISKKNKTFRKDFESRTEVGFTKGYIDYFNTSIDYDDKGKEAKTVHSKCSAKKYIKD